ncbi:MAG: ABC transporter substrate-binding protein [Desulfobacteraceae bacterium]|nr:ABC transporter substrate-binding protein [Desulfobacteraceae bacterium]
MKSIPTAADKSACTEKRWWLVVAVLVCMVLPASMAHSGTRITEDQAGRRVEISRPFTKIISLYGAHTENLFRLGLDTEIIGVSSHETYPEAALKKPVFFQRDDAEKFLAARPDLVLIRPMLDRGYPKLFERLEKSGIVVFSIQPTTVEEMYAYWELLGLLTGKSEPALKMVEHFRQAIHDFRLLTRGLSDQKSVYFEAIHRKMKTFSPRSMAVFALQTAGGVNVAVDAAPMRNSNIAAFGKERILSHASNIDVYLAQTGTMNAVTTDMIRNEPGFHLIKAIQHNQIHLVDEKIVSRPTFRILEGIFTIGHLLYPDLFETRGRQILTTAASGF